MSDKTKLCIFRMTPELHHKIRSEALKMRITLQEWMEDAVEDKMIKDKVIKD